MNRRIFLILSALLAAAAQTAQCQTTAPADFNQTAPRGALKLFFAADIRGDGQAMRRLLLTANAAEERMAAAMAGKKDADRELTGALETRFPDPSKPDPRAGAEAQLPGIFATIDQSEQQINGDTATLKAAGGDSPPFTLQRVDGKWRIPLAVLLQNVEPDFLADQARQIEIQIKVMKSAAVDVAAGKYSTREQAVEDVKQQMFNAAVADHVAATSQPAATQP